MNLRAIGIVRVSEAKGREGDRFVSPRDQAQEEVNRVRQLDRRLSDFTIGPDTDWDLLSLEAKRALIVALIDSVIVRPTGIGAERITITLLEDSPGFRI